MSKDRTRMSRDVSHALRHEPWLYELALGAVGWMEIAAVAAALRQERSECRELGEDEP